MQIKIEELKLIADRLFAHLTATGNATVEIPHDFYWSVPESAAYDPYNQPSDLTLGQLNDDLDRLRCIEEGTAEPLGYALTWLASILRAVGEKTVA